MAGRPLIERVLDRLQGLGDELLLTTNHPDAYAYLGLRMAQDEVPGQGALAGLFTALNAAAGSRVLVVACDMPFLNRELIGYMLGLGSGQDVVVPRWQGRYEPLHAVYARRCLPAIKAVLDAGKAKMTDFFAGVQLHVVDSSEIQRFDPEGRSFFNINTPADLELAGRMLSLEA